MKWPERKVGFTENTAMRPERKVGFTENTAMERTRRCILLRDGNDDFGSKNTFAVRYLLLSVFYHWDGTILPTVTKILTPEC